MCKEAKSLSVINTLKRWNIFEVIQSGEKHIIGYAPNYGFDVITPAISHHEFDRQTKSGIGITRSGCIYSLDGQPKKINRYHHLLLSEFIETHHAQIRFIS